MRARSSSLVAGEGKRMVEVAAGVAEFDAARVQGSRAARCWTNHGSAIGHDSGLESRWWACTAVAQAQADAADAETVAEVATRSRPRWETRRELRSSLLRNG